MCVCVCVCVTHTQETRPHIQELSIRTTIISRYAITAVSCSMVNRRAAPAEALFSFQLPPEALISNFTMIIAGRVFQSKVRPRVKKVKTGVKETSGGRSPETEMAVNIPPGNRAVFLLTYEELLRRHLGRYEHVTRLRPSQLVSRLHLEVTVVDHAPISHLEVLPLRGHSGGSRSSVPPVTTQIQNQNQIWKVTFSPSIVQQAKMSTSGLLGDFIVSYGVQEAPGVGDVQVRGHGKVVFVIDTSASMLGKKIRQIKEALLTILEDLHPEDHFNFISFSTKVRVWRPDVLVPVTPLTVRDAKKFIYSLMPTGGEPHRHRRFNLDSPGASPGSFILFLTDGRPTVGEQRTAVILGKTRLAARGKFCIFTVGIGHEVDYRLLDRMALQNCGMMRRINEQDDASALLKGFYDEIGSPLLSNVRISYSSDLVHFTSQNLFTTYFNGSELAVAGKLSNQSAEALHIRVTATNKDKNLVLETNVPLRRRTTETEKQVGAATGLLNLGSEVPQEQGGAVALLAQDFVERAWGLLSVKDGLRSRLRSQTSRDREEHLQKVTDLSLIYRFTTPLTNLVLENPEVPDDATSAPGPITPISPSGFDESEDPEIEKPERKDLSTDGDPHFVVDFPLSKLSVCFNINGEAGHVLRLLSDNGHSGVTVNGQLIGAPPPPDSHKLHRTYFGSITIVLDRPRRTYIQVTPEKVILDGPDRLILPCDSSAEVTTGALSLSIVEKTKVTVTLGGGIGFVVLLHRYRNPEPYQKNHLGFYISNSQGLSEHSHGLLGQFLHQEVGVVKRPGQGEVLKVKGRPVPVVQKSRRIYGGVEKVDCWFVKNNGHKLIEGRYQDYVMTHMFDSREWKQEVQYLTATTPPTGSDSS
uniref:Inter-alpha-trypsin inhibitor heavy chain 5 n=1 Tax=Cynoglossus semilaevis TaxID=244447 RepID=A0A3P8WV99_CYNSE